MISFQILGKPFGDNSLLVSIDTGQSIFHLLFDCGEGCLSTLPAGIVQRINQLFFSHLHMDHIGGFDSFFRSNYNRNSIPNHIWGPPETSTILKHRFQGFMWNLHKKMSSNWFVTDIYPDKKATFLYKLQEAFSITHEIDVIIDQNKFILDNRYYTIEAFTLNHQTPSMAYLVREKSHLNINTNQMSSLGLSPGPWLKNLLDFKNFEDKLILENTCFTFEELRKKLIIETPGSSIAYLTDFFPDEHTIKQLSHFLHGCRTIVCEAKYKSCDLELARKNFHSTSLLSASIASQAQAGELILFHLSDRYNFSGHREILNEAKQIFPNTSFPVEWDL